MKYGLMSLLLILAVAAFVPQQAPERKVGIFLLSGVRDCCENPGPQGYCCDNCCWVTNDCDDDSDCKDN